MVRVKRASLFLGGLVATLGVLVLTLIARAVGPSPDPGELYGAIFNKQVTPERFTNLWWVGMASFFLLGAVAWPIVLEWIGRVDRNLNVSAGARVIGRGLLIGILGEAILKPLAGFGFFSLDMLAPVFNIVVSSLIGLVYSAIYWSMRPTGVEATDSIDLREAA